VNDFPSRLISAALHKGTLSPPALASASGVQPSPKFFISPNPHKTLPACQPTHERSGSKVLHPQQISESLSLRPGTHVKKQHQQPEASPSSESANRREKSEGKRVEEMSESRNTTTRTKCAVAAAATGQQRQQ